MSDETRSVALRELCDHKPGKYLSKDQYSDGGPFPVFGSNSVMGSHTRFLFEGPLSVLARIGSNCGAVMYSAGPCWVNNNASALVARDGVDPRWLHALVSTMPMDNFRAGSGQPFIRVEDLLNSPVIAPPLSEQRRIAGVLGALNNLIEINQRLANSCEELATSLVLRAEGRTVLSDLSIASKAKAVVPTGQTDHYSLPAFDVDRLPERVDGSLIKSNKTPLSEPSVLVSRLNPHIPRVWMVYPSFGVLSAASTEFVPLVGTSVTPEEVWAVCASPDYLLQMNGLVTGTTGSHQRVDKAALLTVEVPDVRGLPDSTREAIVLAVREAHSARSSVRELAAVRDELLPLLLSGRITVREVAA